MSNQDYSLPDPERFEQELIERAAKGDAEAGRELLESVAVRIYEKDYDSPVFPYLANCLLDFLQHGSRLDRALNVEAENLGGRRPKHDRTALAAVDILLRDHAHYKSEAALKWIMDNVDGVDRRYLQRARAEHDRRYNKHTDENGRLMESLDLESLLHLSGSLRQKVAEVLPQA
jgi:hypothetical protein